MAAMAPLMAENGVELEVAFFHDRPGVKNQFIDAGIPLIHVPHGRSRLLTVWRLRRVIKERQPDLVHTMVFEADIIGRTAAFLARVPVMSSIINEMYGPEQLAVSRHPWKVRLGQALDILTARFVKQFHAITNTVADVMAPRLRIDRSKIIVIYRGRDLEQLGHRTPSRRQEVRRGLGIPDDVPVLLAVGRHEPQKGLDRLLTAMPSVRAREPRSLLLVAGRRGSVTPSLERQIAELGLTECVRLLGHRPDVANLLTACDVMVFPSLWEGLGGSIIEAMMLRCPVVCSDLPVLREVADAANADGLVNFVECAEPTALAAGITDALHQSHSEQGPLVSDLAPFMLDRVSDEYARCAIRMTRPE